MSDGYNRNVPAPYDLIADEYYDHDLHRTSRNFDYTTRVALAAGAVRDRIPQQGLVLDVGAGRGRCHEFLGVDPDRVVQLDSSARMLTLDPRERSLLRVRDRAESMAFIDSQFCCVTAFLCDAFLGLDFLKEAFRVLVPNGILIGTIPAYEWGTALRAELKVDLGSTRFITRARDVLTVPSTLVTVPGLASMLRQVGFADTGTDVKSYTLPRDAMPISQDIQAPADKLGKAVHELPILYSFIAKK